MIKLSTKGNLNLSSIKWLSDLQKKNYTKVLEKYGQIGVEALSSATPIDSGVTASSWYYRVSVSDKYASLEFYNSNINDGVSIALILQYGHGTGTGGWVEGVDYINPAIRPIFDEVARSVWREVTSV